MPALLRGHPALLFLTFVLTLVLLFSTACSRQSPATPLQPSVTPPAPASVAPALTPVSAVATPAPPTDLQARLEAIEQQVIASRGLQRLAPIEKRLISREEAGHYIAAEFERERAEYEIRNTVYKLLDLIPEQADLVSLLRDLVTSQASGFYDPRVKALFVITESAGLTAGEELTLAHELTHALQDQHFNLERLQRDARADWDRNHALSALVEGDATALATAHALRGQRGLVPAGGAFVQAQELTTFPIALQRELLFPYVAGTVFVTHLLSGSNWPAVNAAYTRLPATTEQVLHPEKYGSGELAKPVSLPDLTPHLGAGWRRLGSSTFGEFNLRNYLGLELGAEEVAEAANGWGGDSWTLYGDTAGNYLFFLAIAWDTETDRTEFFVAYRDWLQRRGGAFQSVSEGSLRWQGQRKSIAIEQRPDATRVIIATSATALERALAAE